MADCFCVITKRMPLVKLVVRILKRPKSYEIRTYEISCITIIHIKTFFHGLQFLKFQQHFARWNYLGGGNFNMHVLNKPNIVGSKVGRQTFCYIDPSQRGYPKI